MIIPGYLDGWEPPFARSPLVDGSDLMSSELFWPAFLYAVGGSASAPDAFGGDPADLDELLDRFEDTTRWPVFSLPLAARDRVHIVLRNLEDDRGVDYVLAPDGGARSIPLAAIEGCFRGPALAWPELLAAAHQPDEDRTPAERLLLLLPVCADIDLPDEAVDLVAAALTSLGARSGAREVSAELLACGPFWAPAQWASLDGVLLCLGTHSYRCLESELSSAERRHLARAFSARG